MLYTKYCWEERTKGIQFFSSFPLRPHSKRTPAVSAAIVVLVLPGLPLVLLVLLVLLLSPLLLLFPFTMIAFSPIATYICETAVEDEWHEGPPANSTGFTLENNIPQPGKGALVGNMNSFGSSGPVTTL